MKKRAKKGLAFTRIRTGLENAIAHAEGRRALAVREVELFEAPRRSKRR